MNDHSYNSIWSKAQSAGPAKSTALILSFGNAQWAAALAPCIVGEASGYMRIMLLILSYVKGAMQSQPPLHLQCSYLDKDVQSLDILRFVRMGICKIRGRFPAMAFSQRSLSSFH